MITDKNKGITNIKYNHLNLPTEIAVAGGNKIYYHYNATGQKLEKIVENQTQYAYTNYLNGFQYTKTNNDDWALRYFPTAEGYVQYIDGIFFKYITLFNPI